MYTTTRLPMMGRVDMETRLPINTSTTRQTKLTRAIRQRPPGLFRLVCLFILVLLAIIVILNSFAGSAKMAKLVKSVKW